MVIPYRFELCTWHHRNNCPPFPRKESRRLLFFLLVEKSMDVYFKPYKTGMVTVKEKYPCDRRDGKGRNHVYYLCQCDYGKEFIVSGDELSHNPYSCGCTPKPMKGKGSLKGNGGEQRLPLSEKRFILVTLKIKKMPLRHELKARRNTGIRRFNRRGNDFDIIIGTRWTGNGYQYFQDSA